MARAMWSGFLTFGLVSLPVGLYNATKENTLHFNQLHRNTSHRIRYKKVDEVTGEEVANEDIESGYDLGGGHYAVVDREELRAMAPERSEVIEITDFVNLVEIDPMFFRQAYYLAPRGRGADRAYALLHQAMRETNRAGIATLVLRDKEHLVVVRHSDAAIVLETMYFADEIRDPKEVLPDLPIDVEFKGRELGIAKQLIESLSASWHPDQYRDTYRERMEELIEEKRRGHLVTVSAERPRSNVVDLMAALEASLARTGRSRPQVESVRKESSAGQGAQQQQFDGMSKAELLERATAIDLPGRSKMSKPELVKALTKAPRVTRTGKRHRAS